MAAPEAPAGSAARSARQRDWIFINRIERLLGLGGMGAVYLAHELALDRDVAIKVLPPEHASTPQLRERFKREARTAARLSHTNIVPLHTFGEVSGLMYFVMGYVAGESLGARIRRQGPFDSEAARTFLASVCDALDYAHRQGIVHHDIKPDNILIEANSGAPLLTDFGIAKATLTDAQLTTAGQLIGTPHYMSPEQAMGKADVGPRSDFLLARHRRLRDAVGSAALRGRDSPGRVDAALDARSPTSRFDRAARPPGSRSGHQPVLPVGPRDSLVRREEFLREALVPSDEESESTHLERILRDQCGGDFALSLLNLSSKERKFYTEAVLKVEGANPYQNELFQFVSSNTLPHGLELYPFLKSFSKSIAGRNSQLKTILDEIGFTERILCPVNHIFRYLQTKPIWEKTEILNSSYINKCKTPGGLCFSWRHRGMQN